MGDTEYGVEITNRQQFLAPFSEPLLACVNLTLRAVAIPARMEFDLLIPTARPEQLCGNEQWR
jgi:hypothetical protein